MGEKAWYASKAARRAARNARDPEPHEVAQTKRSEAVQASSIRKGSVVKILGVHVRVTKREKWSATNVKIHFEDIGHGLPSCSTPNNTYTLSSVLFMLHEDIEVL